MDVCLTAVPLADHDVIALLIARYCGCITTIKYIKAYLVQHRTLQERQLTNCMLCGYKLPPSYSRHYIQRSSTYGSWC